MPPSPQPPSPPPARRPGPSGVPGGWILLILLSLLLALLLFQFFGTSNVIDYSDFLNLVYSPEMAKHLRKVTFRGKETIEIEVVDANHLPDGMQPLPAAIRSKLWRGKSCS